MLYDNFEIAKVAEYQDADGTTFCEPIIGDDVPEGAIRAFWTVYGHVPSGGVDALFDCVTLELAEDLHKALMGMLNKHKSHIYPEITCINDGFTTPDFPGVCPVCGSPAIDDMAYSCGGRYERKPQAQQHHKVWWGVCGLHNKGLEK